MKIRSEHMKNGKQMNGTDVFRPWTIGFIRIFMTLVGLPAMLRTHSQRWRVATAGWVALQAGLLWFGAVALQAGTHYVATSALSVSPYTSWDNAASNIEWAVNVATNGETVIVSNGTYTLTNQVNIFSNITVRSFTEQGHGTNDTIVNGNYPLYTNRCFYLTNSPTLSGFTISNGYAYNGGGGGVRITNGGSVLNCYIYKNYSSNDGGYAADYGGGGISVYRSGLVSNCAIVSNTVFADAAATEVYKTGGGIAFSSSGGLIVDSQISGNSAYQGGGAAGTSGGTISNCTIANNQAYRGGGVYNQGVTILKCLVNNNVALAMNPGHGGGAYGYAAGTIRDSTFIGNVAASNGGGVCYSTYGGLVSNCQFIANSARQGGGIYNDDSAEPYPFNAVNCVIVSNSTSSLGGGVYILRNGALRNCLIYGNTNNSYAAGVYLWWAAQYPSNPRDIVNCTIVNNTGVNDGAGLYYQYAANNTSAVVNCIIYSNNATGSDYDEIYNTAAAATNWYSNNCIRVAGAVDTTLPSNQGNITNNPMFVDWANCNYRLGANSPCINAGKNQSWMTNGMDLFGRTRIRYGTVDMGPYELIRSGTIYFFH